MHRYWPWLIVVLLGVAGFLAPLAGLRYFELSPQDNAALSGALGGALVGTAGALLAMLIVDRRQRTAADETLRERRENAKKLIAAELVNVAMSMIGSKRTMDTAVETVREGGTLPQSEHFDRDMPRSMPLTDSLGADLLILEAEAIGLHPVWVTRA